MKYLMICGDLEIAKYVSFLGVDTIFVDLERKGKLKRQGVGTWISDHNLETVTNLRKVSNSELLVRIDPICNESKFQIDEVISRGADNIMLPMIKNISEVEFFLENVNSQIKTTLLIETKESLEILDEITDLKGVDKIYIGLNDLHLSLNQKFMFQSLYNGILEDISRLLNLKNIEFGFGGISKIGHGEIKAEMILSEHIRLGSQSVILSRSFHNKSKNLSEIKLNNFETEFKKLKLKEEEIKKLTNQELERLHLQNKSIIKKIYS